MGIRGFHIITGKIHNACSTLALNEPICAQFSLNLCLDAMKFVKLFVNQAEIAKVIESWFGFLGIFLFPMIAKMVARLFSGATSKKGVAALTRLYDIKKS